MLGRSDDSRNGDTSCNHNMQNTGRARSFSDFLHIYLLYSKPPYYVNNEHL